MNDTFTIPITKLRQNAADVISQVVDTGVSAIVMQRSRPRVIIADYDYFTSLEQDLIDLLDAKEAEKAKKEPSIAFKKYINKRWGNNF